MGDFSWETKKVGQHFMQESSVEAAQIESAYQAGQKSITRSFNEWLKREGDTGELTYTLDFRTMVQVCDQHPTRKREYRRVDRDLDLTDEQVKAIKHVEMTAFGRKSDGKKELQEKVERLGLSKYGRDDWKQLTEMEDWVVNQAPFIVHMMFDKDLGGGKLLIDALLEDSSLRNLFEVGHGCGSTHKPARDSWEQRAFNGAYDDAEPHVRPKYGTINLTNTTCGVKAARQYGTSYFVLKDDVRWRCTMTDRDSSSGAAEPATLGLWYKFFHRFDDAELRGIAVHDGTAHFDDYPEIQIHGPVRFNEDMVCIVGDDSLADDVKRKVDAFGSKHGLRVTWQNMDV